MTYSALVNPRLLGCMLALLLVLSGCRTYGDYNNEALTFEQIREANRLFGEELERARSDLATLKQIETGNTMMQPGVEQFATTVLMHEVMQINHLRLAEEVDEDDYREVHRLYGAIIAEQDIIRERYDHVLRGMVSLSDTTESQRLGAASFYQVAPQFYERMMAENQRMSVRKVMDRSRTMSAPVVEDPVEAQPVPPLGVTPTGEETPPTEGEEAESEQ